jgi:hypothetical protein
MTDERHSRFPPKNSKNIATFSTITFYWFIFPYFLRFVHLAIAVVVVEQPWLSLPVAAATQESC